MHRIFRYDYLRIDVCVRLLLLYPSDARPQLLTANSITLSSKVPSVSHTNELLTHTYDIMFFCAFTVLILNKYLCEYQGEQGTELDFGRRLLSSSSQSSEKVFS